MLITYLPHYETVRKSTGSPYFQLVQIQNDESEFVYHCFVWTRVTNSHDARFWKKDRPTKHPLNRAASFGHPHDALGRVNGIAFNVPARDRTIGAFSREDIEQINAKQLTQREFDADLTNLSLLLRDITERHSRTLETNARRDDYREAVLELASASPTIRRIPLRPNRDRHPVDLRGTNAFPSGTRVPFDDL